MTLAPAHVPPAPGFFERHWPGPGRPASRTALVAALLTGGVAAVTRVLDKPGIGWLAVGLAVAATAVATAWKAGQRRPTPGQLGWGLAALALLAVGGLRAADWLFAYCLLGALLAGSLAVAGGRTVAGLAAGMSAGTLAGFRALRWAWRGVTARRVRHPGGPRVGLALLVAFGLVTVFGSLLANADVAFESVLNAVSPRFGTGDTGRAVFCFVIGTAVGLGTAFLAARRPTFDALEPVPARPVRRVEWAVPLAALDLLLVVYAAVQFAVFFGGRWGGLDYARYTRSGFGQLVVTTVLTLVVLAVATRVAPRRERADRILLRLLLGGLAALALVIVASALLRLARYEQAYGWTRLRVLVGAVEVWLGVLFLLVLAAGIRLRAAWLPRAVAGTAVAGLLIVALVSPDRFIADRDVDRYQRTGDIDIAYLSTLSPDAVPALNRLPDRLRACALYSIDYDLTDLTDDWRTWNLGRAQARAVIAALPRPVYQDCRD
jgi:hypothetical protein